MEGSLRGAAGRAEHAVSRWGRPSPSLRTVCRAGVDVFPACGNVYSNVRQPPTQCDEGKPTCKRCEKSKRECGGYRPEFEIVHRDQTTSTLRRLRKTAGLEHGQPSTSRPLVFVQEEPEHRHQRRRSSLSPTPEAALNVPLAYRGSCYFASNFILLPLGSAPHGFMEYLVPLIEAEPPNSALRYSFNACAFALLGNRAHADGVDLAQLSLKEHTLALAQTHKALSDPAVASTDSTLAAVLLLCLYEVRRSLAPTEALSVHRTKCADSPDPRRLLRLSRLAGCWRGVRTLTVPSTSSRHGVEKPCFAPGWERFCSLRCGTI